MFTSVCAGSESSTLSGIIYKIRKLSPRLKAYLVNFISGSARVKNRRQRADSDQQGVQAAQEVRRWHRRQGGKS